MFEDEMFFRGWTVLVRTAVVGALAYAGLVFMLRISGKRTLAKMNSFDLVVTVALGSTLASILLDKNVSLAEGLTAFGLLILLQFLVTWSSVRNERIRRIARSEPSLLLYQGEFLRDGMLLERVTEAEILQSIRAEGIHRVEDVEGVVLETNGTLSVVQRGEQSGRSTLSPLIG